MTDKVTFRKHGWIKFNEGERRWGMPDPTDPAGCDAAHAARYNLRNMTQAQAFRLAEVYEAYHHLLTHPSGAEYTVGQLRAMRRAIRDGEGSEDA